MIKQNGHINTKLHMSYVNSTIKQEKKQKKKKKHVINYM